MGSLLAAENHAYFRTYLIASVAGIYSLFPLLFTPAGQFRSFPNGVGDELMASVLPLETLIELAYSIAWGVMILLPMQRRVYE